MLFNRIVLQIILLFTFLFLITSTRIFAEEELSNLLTSQDTLKRDTIDVGLNVESIREFESGLGGIASLKLGLGHHDNFAKDTSIGGRRLETADLYWAVYLELGIRYSSLSFSVLGSFIAPLPRTNLVNGYTHQGELDDKILLLRWRMLKWGSKINFFPIIGHRWIFDYAKIYDKGSNNPEILNLKYKDKGPFYGADVHYSVIRKGHKDYRLILSYTYENLNIDINKYKISLAKFSFLARKEKSVKGSFHHLSYLSLGMEYITWKGGRKDWFITASIGGSIDAKRSE